MRVIAGKAKGRVLVAPEGMNTRPIMAKMKEALFSSWQFNIYDARFLDLFAGSGSMGIEAMSRGAKHVAFVEHDKAAIDVIKKNLNTCKFTDGVDVFQDDVFQRLKWFQTTGQKFDIIYIDPPFTVDSIFIPVMEAVAETEVLDADGTLAIRTLKEKEMPETFGKLSKYKKKVYGISAIHFYRYEE